MNILEMPIYIPLSGKSLFTYGTDFLFHNTVSIVLLDLNKKMIFLSN